MSKAGIFLDGTISWIIIITLAALPLFFLPTTPNFYFTNKLMLLTLGALTSTALWVLRIFWTDKPPRFINTSAFFMLPLVAIIGISLLSVSDNKIEAIIAPGGLLQFFCSFLLIFLYQTVASDKHNKFLFGGLIISVSILGIIAIYQFYGIGRLMFPQIQFLNEKMWTPTGSPLTSLSLFIIMIPLVLYGLVSGIIKRNETQMALFTVAVGLVGAGLVFTLISLLPQISGQSLPAVEGWRIIFDTYKSPLQAMLGIGAENFPAAFTAGRSINYNTFPFWNTRFLSSTNALFHLATTFGIFGLFSFILWLNPLLLNFKGQKPAIKASIILTLLCLMFTPPNIVIYCLLLSFIAFISPKTHIKATSFSIGPIRLIFAGMTLMIVALTGYLAYRFYRADIYFNQSLQKASKNDGTGTYNLQIKAITTNPYITSYHLAYSQTNLALANSITASQNNDRNNTLSDKDRQLVSQLLQQSIREAKLGTNLAPKHAVAWETLAGVYRTMIGVVKDADLWAIASYKQAINLDQYNPMLRFNLAGTYMVTKDYARAIASLNDAIELKNTVPNFHYNLAFIYRVQNEYKLELLALEECNKLLPANSDEAKTVAREIAEAKSNISKSPAPSTLPVNSDIGNTPLLTQPQTTPGHIISPKLDLPPEASPEAIPLDRQAIISTDSASPGE